MHGGDWVAQVLKAQGVQFIFTLTGGHIAPILVAAKQRDIRVVDVRHEVNAVFAADAVARLTGIPGVAAVTAGPGVTNTLTAVKNAQMAQSPVIVLGGAAATALQGRGALQDIDQLSLFKSVVKWSKSVRRVKDIAPTIEKAFYEAQSGVPGPVFVELPIDLLYEEQTVRTLYQVPTGKSLQSRAIATYLKIHVNRLFAGSNGQQISGKITPSIPKSNREQVRQVAQKLLEAEKPLFLVGAQCTLDVDQVHHVAAALGKIGAPAYLSSMARGLLGKNHPLQMRHKRRNALKEADFVLLAGVPCDFRLDYGNHIRGSSFYVSANLSKIDLNKNRRPNIGVLGDPGEFLRLLADELPAGSRWTEWIGHLRERNDARDAEIRAMGLQATGKINPIYLFQEMEKEAGDNVILIADGGDFVGTASYIVQPPGPLTWLDPGPFGTLGVGAGFALGAKLVRPDSEVWIIYGDGSVGYTLAEFDTFARHDIPVIALVGNDAGWSQIAREQVEILKDDVATVLAHTDYERSAAGLGGEGIKVDDPELVPEALEKARSAVKNGKPVLLNAIIGKTDFRKGSISM
ncbi:MAG: thiamine pyrophosphate-binding protein [Ardenticatenaceae bacterium]|nr:thiamine pyrophosphate-binding protein [Ardenticatenaceae bacterium]